MNACNITIPQSGGIPPPPPQSAINAENVSIWWRRYVFLVVNQMLKQVAVSGTAILCEVALHWAYVATGHIVLDQLCRVWNCNISSTRWYYIVSFGILAIMDTEVNTNNLVPGQVCGNVCEYL